MSRNEIGRECYDAPQREDCLFVVSTRAKRGAERIESLRGARLQGERSSARRERLIQEVGNDEPLGQITKQLDVVAVGGDRLPHEFDRCRSIAGVLRDAGAKVECTGSRGIELQDFTAKLV